LKTVKEIIEDLQTQSAHYSHWFTREPDGIWDKNKQERHDKKCTNKDCILRLYEPEKSKNIDQIYESLNFQSVHVSFWFGKGWTEMNQEKHRKGCRNMHCILITHRKKTTMKQALKNGRLTPPVK